MGKLAILSAGSGDFLRVSVSPISGGKGQNPLGHFSAILVSNMTMSALKIVQFSFVYVGFFWGGGGKGRTYVASHVRYVH